MSPALHALIAAAERLERVDPEALSQVLAAAQAFVAVCDQPDEAKEVFAARIARILPAPGGRRRPEPS
ncbi:MAG: hypothetical protein NT062_19595 [Proteobacteria bacterium]|nr:hypothetical protein [Pseudomonadota bacterium]